VPQKPLAAPKPAVEKPVTEKVRTASEPATPKPEKKLAEVAPPAAKPAGNKAQEAAEAYQRGNAKLLSGALPEAIAAFSEAVKLNPKDAQSQRGLGLAYAQSGNAAQAVRHLRLYLKASPNAPDRALMEKRIDQLGGR
jgi:Flp pilus assembly protein TadD